MAKPTDKITFKQLQTSISKGQVANPESNDVDDDNPHNHARLPGIPATRGQTAASLRPMPHADVAARYMERIHTHGVPDNTPVPYQPQLARTPENLPAVFSTEMIIDDPDLPKWHMVSNLPGYISASIRAVGQQMFSKFTRTPIDKIQVVSTLSNTPQQLLKVSKWLRDHGRFDRQITGELQGMLPGYQSDIRVYHAAGYTFIAVSDFTGHYIYCWPEH